MFTDSVRLNGVTVTIHRGGTYLFIQSKNPAAASALYHIMLDKMKIPGYADFVFGGGKKNDKSVRSGHRPAWSVD